MRLVFGLLALSLASCTAPDIYSPAGLRKLQRVSERVDILSIAIHIRGQKLWSGVARVSRMQSGRIAAEAVLPRKTSCPRPPPPTQLTIDAEKYGGNANDPDTYRFRIVVERSELGRHCERMDRTAAVEQTSRMREGEQTVLTGEHGLRVTVRRRS